MNCSPRKAPSDFFFVPVFYVKRVPWKAGFFRTTDHYSLVDLAVLCSNEKRF